MGADVSGLQLRFFQSLARVVAGNEVPCIFAEFVAEFDQVPVRYFRIEHALDIAFGQCRVVDVEQNPLRKQSLPLYC